MVQDSTLKKKNAELCIIHNENSTEEHGQPPNRNCSCESFGYGNQTWSSVYMDGNKSLQDQHLKWVLQEVMLCSKVRFKKRKKRCPVSHFQQL